MPFTDIARGPVGTAAIAKQYDPARIVLLGVGNGCIQTRENSFSIRFVITVGGCRLAGVLAGFPFCGCRLFDTGIGVVRGILGRRALALGHRLTRCWCSFDAGLRAVDQKIGQAQAQTVPATIRKFAAQGADRFRPVSSLSCTGEDNQRALRLAGVGGLP
ncbi:hypothetical protein D3C77_431280 [compost metagenome]